MKCLSSRQEALSSSQCQPGSCRNRQQRLNVQARGSGGKRPPPRFNDVDWRGPDKLRHYKASDGKEHLGTALSAPGGRPFPGPPPDEGPPLRVLPVGGLGEIGMNCMLVGAKGRYILIDAGLMFPDFTDLGMQKILPDTSFLYQWRDKIEALVITHGHEDHIGALPWVVPALDPSTPIYATSFVMQLIKRRLSEFSLFDESRFKTFTMRTPFEAGPFQVEAVRVTHSIPDCCGLVLRSEHGTIVHTGDWKIDETPLDGQEFDRSTFDMLGKEKVALMMSDSTNVLAPGRTTSEAVVKESLIQKVLAHQGKGRVVVTQFASNLTRLRAVKAAADAAGRKICFVGASLNHYLEAAWQDGQAPFDPQELISPEDLKRYNANEVLVVTTGSQGEPNAQLSKAAREAAPNLKIQQTDLLLYSAKVIPGNEPQVSAMMNKLSMLGARVMQGRGDNLHTSGHAYQDELKEVLRLVKPQHFLPVHGEFSFLVEHARLAHEEAGVQHCEVIRNGQMLGIRERPSRGHVSSGSQHAATMEVLGKADLVQFYNDGNKGTGNEEDMRLMERRTLAFDGIVVLSIDITRNLSTGTLQGRVRLTTRGMWTDEGELHKKLHKGVTELVGYLPVDAHMSAIERAAIDGVKKMCKGFNEKKPEVICICHENDPRNARIASIPDRAQPGGRARSQGDSSRPSSQQGWQQQRPWQGQQQGQGQQGPVGGRGGGGGRGQGRPSGATPTDDEVASQGTNRSSEAPAESQVSQTTDQQAHSSEERAHVRRMLAERQQVSAERSSSTDGTPSSAPRRGRPAGPPSPTGLQVVPEEVMARRRAANPRDNNPGAAADPDSVAFD